jgi:hypothetical protein
MNRRRLCTYTFCFLLLAQPAIGIAMETLSAAEQQEIAQALQEVAALNVDRLMAEAQAEAQKMSHGATVNQPPQLTHLPDWARYAIESSQSALKNAQNLGATIQKERDAAKWQNTVVLAHPKVPVALYRRDLIELPFLAGDIALAYWFFHTFRQNRIKHIVTTLTQNIDWHIEKFEQLELIDKKIADGVEPTMSFADIITATKALQEEKQAVWQEIMDGHHYLGYNPFKREIIIPFLSAIVGHKASRYAQGKLLVKQSFVPEAFFAYQPDGQLFNLDETWQPSMTAIQQDLATMKAKQPNTYYKIQEQNGHGGWQDMANPPFHPNTLTNQDPRNILLHSPDPQFKDIEQIKLNHGAIYFNKNSAHPLRLEQYTLPDESLQAVTAAAQAGNTMFWQAFKGLFFWNGAPIATSTALKMAFVSNPNAPSVDYGPPVKKIAEDIDHGIQMVIPEGTVTRAWYHFLGLPSWFYGLKNSAPARYALEIAIMCGALFVVNGAYHLEWAKLLDKETVQLRTLLYGYKATQHLPDTDRDKKKVLKDLKAFVAKGNTITGTGVKSAVRELFNIQDMGKINVNFKVTAWMLTITNALLLWKLRHLRHVWPYAKLSWQAGYIEPQEALIGATIAGFGSVPALIYASVSRACASNVIGDIKAVAGNIKNFFTRRKKKEEKTEEQQSETTKTIDTNESNDNQEI